MYSVSHGKMKTTEPGTDLKAEGPLGVASLLVGAWVGRATAAQRLGFRQHLRTEDRHPFFLEEWHSTFVEWPFLSACMAIL